MRQRLAIVSLVLCAAVFVAGLARLFQLRFAVGDVYPEYSSLRADPLGAMAFYESLQRMPGLAVRRDFSPGNRLPEGRRVAYLHLAAAQSDWEWMPDELAGEIQRFLARGGRLAVSFFPVPVGPFRQLPRAGAVGPPASPPKKSPQRGKQANPPPDKTKREVRAEESLVSLKEKWGVEFGSIPLPHGEAKAYLPVRVANQTALPLPATLDWHSALVLTNVAPSWQTIYARDAHPVLVERRFGAGSIVLATDSYFLSNQALRQDRHAQLLAWFVGPGKEVVFDEAHFGILETPGVATLMRKYRLHGLAAGLLLLAGLFIWKNGASFVPPPPPDEEPPYLTSAAGRTGTSTLRRATEDGSALAPPPGQGPAYVTGRDAAAGFVNLLRRNIPPRDVLKLCFSEWTRSLWHGGGHSLARIDQAQSVLEAEFARPERERDPVRAYREICRALKKGNR